MGLWLGGLSPEDVQLISVTSHATHYFVTSHEWRLCMVMTPAERQAKRREKMQGRGKHQVLVWLDNEHLEMLARISNKLETSRNEAIKRCISAACRGLDAHSVGRKKRLAGVAPEPGQPMRRSPDGIFRLED